MFMIQNGVQLLETSKWSNVTPVTLAHRPTFWPKLGCLIVMSHSYVGRSIMAEFINKAPEQCVVLRHSLYTVKHLMLAGI